MQPEAVQPEPDRAPRGRAIHLLVISAVGLLALGFAISSGRTDTALLFVALPTLLALAIAAGPPAKSLHWLTFKALTVALLMTSVFLHEGAICVLFAAPLVYAVGHCVIGLARWARGRGLSAFLPVVLLLGLEGVDPGLRVVPDQSATVTRTVDLPAAEVAGRITRGPAVSATPVPWRLTGLPLPAHAGGQGIDPGDQWVFHFDGDNHGPGGVLLTEVDTSTVTGTGGQVTFRTVSDSSIVGRWLDWHTSTLRWHTVDSDTTQVTLTLGFTRGLDPFWYFGPIQNILVDGAAGYLLDTLALAES